MNVHVEYSRPNKIYENVIAQQIDLGIVAYPQKHPQIVVIPIRDDHLVLACPPDHPLANMKRIPVARLEGETLIGYERDIATRKATDQMLRNHHVNVHYSAEYDNIETIKRAVEIGQGVAIVPLPAVRHEVEHGTAQSRAALGRDPAAPAGHHPQARPPPVARRGEVRRDPQARGRRVGAGGQDIIGLGRLCGGAGRRRPRMGSGRSGATDGGVTGHTRAP